MTLVFSELSAENKAHSKPEAAGLMRSMVTAITSLAEKHAPTLLTIESFDLFGTLLTDGYSIGSWLQDARVDRDDRAFFLRITTKVALDREAYAAVKDRFRLSEFHLGDVDASGLGLSYLLKSVSISLNSHEYWRRVLIPIRHIWLDEHTNFQEAEVVALNLAEAEQAGMVTDEMASQAQADLAQSPRTLLTAIRPSFPHLGFGLDVEGQLLALSVDVFQPIIAKLVVLDGAIRDWRRDRPKLPSLPMVHSESLPTMQEYGEQRIFRDSSGLRRSFKLHAMVGGAHRIHVRIDQRRRSLEVGYIGKHLPTARFSK